jgi:ketosteroid isomerase-like protein
MILPLMLLAAVASQPVTAQLTDAEKAAIEDEVSALQDEFWDRWREGDFDRAVSHYWDSPDLTIAIDGVIYHGYAEIIAKARPGYAYVESMDITITSSETIVLAPDVACTMVSGTNSATFTDGTTITLPDFAFSAIWMRDSGEWKIHIMHESHPSTESSEH